MAHSFYRKIIIHLQEFEPLVAQMNLPAHRFFTLFT